jgi:cell division protease FtsH
MFYGRDMGHSRDYSEKMAELVDGEIRKFIEQAHSEAHTVLSQNRKILDKLALELLEKETLDQEQIAKIFVGIKKLKERPLWLSSDKRPVSKVPPVKVPARKVVAAAKAPTKAAAKAPTRTAAKAATKPAPKATK